MKKKSTISIERCIELEKIVEEKDFKTIICDEYVDFITSFSGMERIYILNAIKMPREEIEEALAYYDSHKFPNNIDEVLFVDTLANKYKVDRDRIVERIRTIRRLKKVEKGKVKAKIRKKITKMVV